MKLWGGRFSKPTNLLVDEFTSSINFDHRLAVFDILGSIAHAKTLEKAGILYSAEVDKITKGLHNILQKIKNNTVVFKIEDEDIHMNIERLLHAEIGDLAGKLHTGRSRNDQVALDMHLYLREQVYDIIQQLHNLQHALLEKAEENIDTILPGYTHLQRAEPVRLAHHLLAYIAMFQRDIERLCDSWKRINVSPLGAGALAGSGIKVDRDYSAQLLNFDSIYENSMDAVSDRDYIVEFQANASLIMMHLSRISEEFILWSSQEFGYIELDDSFCTGSSMMPQKKNPDVPELVRGKTGRVYGALLSILTTLKALPLAYNKDLQEDKEGLFDTIDTVSQSLIIYTSMISSMKVNTQRMTVAAGQDYSNATQVANYLVGKGIAFRSAHEIVGKIVFYCINKNIFLNDMSLKEYKNFDPLFTEDIYSVIAINSVVDAHDVAGGTARTMVVKQIEKIKDLLPDTEKWIYNQRSALVLRLLQVIKNFAENDVDKQ